MVEKILILGGTAEAAELATKLVHAGNHVTTSLAGRTHTPAKVEGKMRIGGFGGVEGLADYLQRQRITKLIDATHPFARQISQNAAAAAELAGICLECHIRAPWSKSDGDRWTSVASLEQACDAIPAGARAFLALGSQHIEPFARRTDIHFVVRMVDQPANRLPFADYTAVVGKPGDKEAEAALLRQHRITHLICRNSGGAAGYAKIAAAREAGLPVIIIER